MEVKVGSSPYHRWLQMNYEIQSNLNTSRSHEKCFDSLLVSREVSNFNFRDIFTKYFLQKKNPTHFGLDLRNLLQNRAHLDWILMELVALCWLTIVTLEYYGRIRKILRKSRTPIDFVKRGLKLLWSCLPQMIFFWISDKTWNRFLTEFVLLSNFHLHLFDFLHVEWISKQSYRDSFFKLLMQKTDLYS